MINYGLVKKYCCEDPSLIENYYKAINDETQTWDIHHRLEINENKSVKQLIAEGHYFNRPASELIFLTRSEHRRLHMGGEKNPIYGRTGENSPMYGRTGENSPMYGRTGEKNPMYGRTGEKNPMYGKPSPYRGKHHSEEWKRKHSESMKGEKHSNFGHCWMTNGINRVYPKKEDADKYIELGYHFGMK